MKQQTNSSKGSKKSGASSDTTKIGGADFHCCGADGALAQNFTASLISELYYNELCCIDYEVEIERWNFSPDPYGVLSGFDTHL